MIKEKKKENIQEKWQNIIETCTQAAEEVVGRKVHKKKE